MNELNQNLKKSSSSTKKKFLSFASKNNWLGKRKRRIKRSVTLKQLGREVLEGAEQRVQEEKERIVVFE